MIFSFKWDFPDLVPDPRTALCLDLAGISQRRTVEPSGSPPSAHARTARTHGTTTWGLVKSDCWSHSFLIKSGMGSESCISIEFPGDADAAGLEISPG